MKTELRLENVERVRDALLNKALTAGTRTVRDATRKLEKDFEDITRRSVPGNLYKAWKSRTYPASGKAAYEPVGMVYINGKARSRGAIQYWSLPGTNRAKSGGWLAIPLPAAGVLNRSRDLTPREWERRTGLSLRISYPKGSGKGRWALLVTDGTMAKNKRGGLKQLTRRRQAQGRERVTSAIFMLIPEQAHRNTMSLAPLIDQARQYMGKSYARRLAAVLKEG